MQYITSEVRAVKRSYICIISALVLCFMLSNGASQAEEPRSLFIHISSDTDSRLRKSLGYSANQMDRGVSVTVYVDDKGVLAFSKRNKDSYITAQKLVERLINGSAKVIVCPFSMKIFNVNPDELLPGVVIGSFEIVDPLLFAPGVRVLNW